MGGAAIFDLDRTLLRGASGAVFGDELRRAGVIDGDATVIERVMIALFNAVGETRPSMLLTRQGVRLTSGWPRVQVALAGRRAARRLADQLQPYASALFDEHRAAGRALVLATTSPYDLAEPLRRTLRFDAAIATRYHHESGRYTGTLDGEFIWGRAKRDAVLAWAAARSIDTADSYAYSDSYFDLPLLRAVGFPVAVNPDPRLTVQAVARGWPVRHLDVPDGVPKLLGVEPLRALTAVARPELFRFARFDFAGLEHVPEHGPVIVAANHRSYFDPVLLALALAKRGRVARFLAKKELFDAPLVGTVVRSLGGIRVDRGSGSTEPLDAAAAALAAGEVVVILPQGTIPRGADFFASTLTGRRGVAVLARQTGVPVVPAGLWGTERVWPRNSRLPHVWNVVDPPTVSVAFGPPVLTRRRTDQGRTEAVMQAIDALLPPLGERPTEPTERDLARTRPRRAAAS